MKVGGQNADRCPAQVLPLSVEDMVLLKAAYRDKEMATKVPFPKDKVFQSPSLDGWCSVQVTPLSAEDMVRLP